ncbi:hypothetical protein Glove_88g46 [Diversispora epigaea]|uniref:Uncharacterized protein n=1 Tax=Diversispora epigaea TaxID=1348612 RepID=A0A397J8B8_9GLOM|nr:hypothetical protein Glove_88g46 [Diversispora epigaea]
MSSGNSRLEFMTNKEIILNFLDECSAIFVGIEGNESVKLGKDKKLLVKWDYVIVYMMLFGLNSHERQCDPQMFASYYKEILTIEKNALIEVQYRRRGRVGFNEIIVYWVDMEKVRSLYEFTVGGDSCIKCDDDFVYGYQLLNPRKILSVYNEDNENLWRSLIPMVRWFEPIRHLQLAIKTKKAVAKVINGYQVGIIYFHLKKNQ